MRIVLFFLILAPLLALPLTGQSRPKTEARQPKAIRVPGVPEKFPVKPQDQRKWFVRWTIKDKAPVNYLMLFNEQLKELVDKAEEAVATEKDRKKPRRSVIKYYKELGEWYANQMKIVTVLIEAKSGLRSVVGSVQPENIKKRGELEEQIKEKTKEFRKVINQKPSKPE